MRAWVNFYGGKWALARRYGPPQREHVVEAFAGFAGYSTYWEPARVTLIEKDPTIIEVWRFLQRASRQEIMAIPTVVESVDELRVCQEAKWLAGWWFDHGLAQPSKQRAHWAKHPRYRAQFWGSVIRHRIAHQVDKIRHWKIIEGEYSKAPDVDAHWFIDPPYQRAGYTYRCNHIDYPALAKWCKQRHGYVQVCENTDANWLPFAPFSIVDSHRAHRLRRCSAEAIFELENEKNCRERRTHAR